MQGSKNKEIWNKNQKCFWIKMQERTQTKPDKCSLKQKQET